MPPRRPTRPAPPDVDLLRASLGQGKLVRVGIAPSGQFPDGVTGRVRRIGDPTLDGDEFIFVEVPVGGAKDVLPFAPNDLIGAPARKRATATATAATAATAPGLQTAGPAAPSTQRSSSQRSSTQRPVEQRPVGQPPAEQRPADERRAPAAGGTRTPPRPGSTSGRGKRAPVSITISTAGDESAAWRIEARIGAKIAVRPTSIPPTRVWEIVQSLGEPKLTTLVQSMLDDHRRATQARADALTAELSAIRAELDSFPEDPTG